MEQAESVGWLLDHDSRDNVMVTLDDPVTIDGLAKITGRELDDALHQAVHAAHAVGELKPYGGIRLWTGVRLTAKALRDLGQWPPHGAEYRQGPWDATRSAGR